MRVAVAVLIIEYYSGCSLLFAFHLMNADVKASTLQRLREHRAQSLHISLVIQAIFPIVLVINDA